MEQDIRFCALDGRRIAYATVGEGPTLLLGGRWVTHLEEEWQDANARSFFEDLGRSHRVVRYDRLGAGLSDREGAGVPTVESETRALRAVLDACGPDPVALFACSCAGVAAAHLASQSPERVSKLVLFGRTNWPLAAQMLAGLMAPRADGEAIDALSRAQRHAASAEVAAAFLELDLTASAAAVLPAVAPPTLVLHRRGDRTVPVSHGRELARLLPNARFVALDGDAHLPWMDEQRALRRALVGFLGDAAAPETNGDSPLSRRETEVLRLVAAGLSNREIASSLVLSEHTVHRHVANVLRKLGQSSRAAAAATATRAGYI